MRCHLQLKTQNQLVIKSAAGFLFCVCVCVCVHSQRICKSREIILMCQSGGNPLINYDRTLNHQVSALLRKFASHLPLMILLLFLLLPSPAGLVLLCALGSEVRTTRKFNSPSSLCWMDWSGFVNDVAITGTFLHLPILRRCASA